MLKTKPGYRCSGCGHQTMRWVGRCPECGEYQTMTAEAPSPPRRAGEVPVLRRLRDVSLADSPRLSTGIGELDRVLGGGLVPGSVVLVGGEPGVGKSTLLLQASHALLTRGATVIYVSGEESPQQLALRAERLGLGATALEVAATGELERLEDLVRENRPAVLVVDSIQTVRSAASESAPGTLSQVREAATRLTEAAKSSGTAVVLVGHVTKEGQIAGPKATEHIVDAVLMFEGETSGALKVLRAVKNRFGSTNEVGLFEMGDTGLRPVADPTAWLLAERGEPVSGTATACVLEGTRPLLVEVEALCAPSPFAAPRRVANGVELARLHLVLAVLEQRCGIRLGQYDVYVNLPGGLRVVEPGVDLAVALAVASSLGDVALPAGCAVIGEVGLTGELRPVSQRQRRLEEIARHGFGRCLAPAAGNDDGVPANLRLELAATLRQALIIAQEPVAERT